MRLCPCLSFHFHIHGLQLICVNPMGSCLCYASRACITSHFKRHISVYAYVCALDAFESAPLAVQNNNNNNGRECETMTENRRRQIERDKRSSVCSCRSILTWYYPLSVTNDLVSENCDFIQMIYAVMIGIRKKLAELVSGCCEASRARQTS